MHMHNTVPEARLFVATGTPVQPHSSVGLEGLDVECRWVPVPPMIFTHVNMPAGLSGLHEFCSHYDIDNPTQDR